VWGGTRVAKFSDCIVYYKSIQSGRRRCFFLWWRCCFYGFDGLCFHQDNPAPGPHKSAPAPESYRGSAISGRCFICSGSSSGSGVVSGVCLLCPSCVSIFRCRPGPLFSSTVSPVIRVCARVVVALVSMVSLGDWLLGQLLELAFKGRHGGGCCFLFCDGRGVAKYIVSMPTLR